MKLALSLLATLVLASCTTSLKAPIGSGGPPRQDSLAMLGQSTRVGGLVATPLVLVEDSRCPINARCVWAGRAIVQTRIDGPGWRETASLTLGQPYSVRRRSITLTSVEPGKMAGSPPVPPQRYVFGYSGGL